MKWEYLVINLGTDGQSRLREHGLNDWELVSVILIDVKNVDITAYLKRPIQPKSEAELLAHFDKPYKQVYDD